MAFPVPLITVLYQRLCSEPVRLDVIDALLRAISAPFDPGESERARVDALLLLIEDSVIGVLQGSDRRRVDVTALHTLLFMSSAYERKLSERGQELLQHFPLSPAGSPRSSPARPSRRPPSSASPPTRPWAGGSTRSSPR